MKNINWTVRFKNYTFWLGLIGVIGSPILAYYGLTTADLTTWQSLWDLATKFIANPYLIGSVVTSVISFLGVIADPTTKGLTDSKQALTYSSPKEE